MTISSGALGTVLAQAQLLGPEQLDELNRVLVRRYPSAAALTKHLVSVGWLTPFQSALLLEGRADELIVSHYVLLDEIGKGGMGTVYKARDTRRDRLAALKLIRPEHADDERAVQRFLREIEVARLLNHPNIVAAYDADQADDRLYLAMEYVEGSDLAKLVLKHGPLPIPHACEFMRQAALGLQYAHEEGLVHRDIKPANLIVTRAGPRPRPGENPPPARPLVKILDFGLTMLSQTDFQKWSTRLTQMGVVVGTVDFLSPEQAVNARDVDIRADLYSLGCTFYFLLTGQVPFPTRTPTEKLLSHQIEDPQPIKKIRPDVPPAVRFVAKKLMAKRRDDRFQTPAEVAVALKQAMAFKGPSLAVSGAARGPGIVSDPDVDAASGETSDPAAGDAPTLDDLRKPPSRVPWSSIFIGITVFALTVSVGLFLLWLKSRT